MKVPKLIYLQVCGKCQDNEFEKCNFDDLAEITWCKDKINDSDAAYFSEESVKQCLKQLIDEINRDYSFATTGKPFRYIRYDVEKTIDEFIGRLKGDNNA